LLPHERAVGTGSGPILEVCNLVKRFGRRTDVRWLSRKKEPGVLALSDVSFAIERGECLGLVGGSGCGKTTVSKSTTRAVEPDSGRISFPDDGRAVDLLDLDRRAMEPTRRKTQYSFQDPLSSLNPRMTVGTILAEPFTI